jgi:adiponectin receptor
LPFCPGLESFQQVSVWLIIAEIIYGFRLDYTGISLLIIGSFVPWIYYGFYCRREPKITYIAMICVLGVASIIVSLWDKFNESRFRALRAGVFVSMGCSGIIPAIHFIYVS